MQDTDTAAAPTRLLSTAEVGEMIGCSRTTLHRRVRAGTFPAPIRTGPNSVRYRSEEVQDWIDSRERVRDVARG